jgi:hypothetical protein
MGTWYEENIASSVERGRNYGLVIEASSNTIEKYREEEHLITKQALTPVCYCVALRVI